MGPANVLLIAATQAEAFPYTEPGGEGVEAFDVVGRYYPRSRWGARQARIDPYPFLWREFDGTGAVVTIPRQDCGATSESKRSGCGNVVCSWQASPSEPQK